MCCICVLCITNYFNRSVFLCVFCKLVNDIMFYSWQEVGTMSTFQIYITAVHSSDSDYIPREAHVLCVCKSTGYGHLSWVDYRECMCF